MEHNITYIKYEVYTNDELKHSGITPTNLLQAITDMYCDFKDSPNTLKLYYKDKTFIVNSPKEFDYHEGWINE